jgi:hypothetical protein
MEGSNPAIGPALAAAVHKAQSMLVKPLTENSQSILEKGTHVVIGISPFNSYFSEARLRELVVCPRETVEC